MLTMRTLFFALLIAATALLAGCGGGDDSTSSTGESGDGVAGMREICLEGREGIAGIPNIMKGDCAKAGVTASSPPPSSPEAEEARHRSERQEAAYEQKTNENPVYERQARISALTSLQEGNRAEAESKLEEGCPKADPDELSDAWWELRQIASGPEAASVSQLEGELEDLCPL